MNKFPTRLLYAPDDPQLRFLPEGPVACDERRLSWVAIQHGAEAKFGSLNLLDCQTGENRVYQLSGRPGFALPTSAADTFVVGMERQVGLYQLASGHWTTLIDGVDGDVEGTIINDGVVFAEGLVFGTKDLQFAEKKAGLYLWRFDDRQLFRLRDDQICSNGKVVQGGPGDWSLLDIDSPTKTVVRYPLDVAGGRLGPARLVVDLRDGDVFPDGMIGTPDGKSVVVALYDPQATSHGEARQYGIESGRVEAVWETHQAPQVTCPQWMHRDGRVRLILTTAVEHMTPERLAAAPNSGCLFEGETAWADLPPTCRFPA